MGLSSALCAGDGRSVDPGRNGATYVRGVWRVPRWMMDIWGWKGWQKQNLGAGKMQVSLEPVNNHCGWNIDSWDAGFGLPTVERSVKKRISQESLSQCGPFCGSVPESCELWRGPERLEVRAPRQQGLQRVNRPGQGTDPGGLSAGVTVHPSMRYTGTWCGNLSIIYHPFLLLFLVSILSRQILIFTLTD